MTSLTERTVRAARWRLACGLVQAAAQFAVGIALARMIAPAEFGLLAMGMLVVTLAGLVSDLGLAPAVIQRRDLSDRHLRVALTTSVLLGALMYGVLHAAAPTAGALLGSERLAALLRWQAAVFVLAPLGATARALLERRLAFRRLFWIDTAAYTAAYAGVAIPLAWAGAGVWSVVAATLTQSLVAGLLLVATVRPPLRPLLARRELRDLAGFGGLVSANRVVNHLALNADYWVVAQRLGPQLLGLYARAYTLMTLPLAHVARAMRGTLFPAFSEAAADRARLARGYLLSVQLTALVTAPVMAGLFVAAPHLVVGLYGPAWAPATAPLQVLCAAGLFRAVYHLGSSVSQATGQTARELRLQVAYAVLVAAGSWVGRRWGLVGVATGVSVAIAFMYLAMARLSLQIVGRSWGDFLRVQLPGVVVALPVAAAAGGLRLVMERSGAGSLAIAVGVVCGSGAALLLGIGLLPPAIRPVELFSHLGRSSGRLPALVRGPVTRILGVAA